MDDRGKTAQENITPHFYNIHGDGKEGLKEAEGKASGAPDGKTASGGGNNPKNVSDGVSASSKNGFQNSVNGKPVDTKKDKGMIKTFSKVGAAALIIVVLFGAIIGVALTPQFLVGNIDYNLQSVLGFGDTVAVLEKQAEYVTATALKEGKVREDYAMDLETNGLLVGQIAANGEFVRTNTFIADLGVPKEIASTGAVYGNEALDISLGKQEDGQLVMKYNNEIINGDNFVAKVESDPKMYYAYSTALDVASRYYYSDEVTKYYNENGFSRNSFASWKPSGNKQTDDENFEKLLKKALDISDSVGLDGLDMEWYENCGKQGKVDKCRSKKSYSSEEQCKNVLLPSLKHWESCEEEEIYVNDVTGKACSDDGDSACSPKVVYWGVFKNNSLEKSISEFEDADALTAAVSEGTMIEGDAELSKEKAVSVLATAMSSAQPYVATKSFLAIEESINRARAGHDGPVNQVMDMASKKVKAIVTDPETGEDIETFESIVNTHNFAIAASDGGPYSRKEAAMYSRDNIINTMNRHGGTSIDEVKINNTSVSTNGSGQGNMLMTMNHEGETGGDLSLTKNILNNTFFNGFKGVFLGSVTGNFSISGGSYLSNGINQYSIGALPSDTAQMVKHDEVVQEVLARKAEAERSSLSPFDISSKNTFFGRIAHDLASTMIHNYGDNNGVGVINTVSTLAGVTNDSIASMMNGAYAADEEDYTMINGDCPTPNSASNSNGDLYCNSHNTVYTGYMSYTDGDYRSTPLGDSLDEEGKIKDNSPVAEIIALGTGRASIVGNANADVCKRYKEMHEEEGLLKALKHFRDFVGVNNYVNQYERCVNEDEEEHEEVDGAVHIPIIDVIRELFGGDEGVPGDVATGAKYTLSDSNPENEMMKLYSAYSMYQMVNSMLTEDENEVTAFKERYYAEHPLDNSPAGIISRRSGMSKKDAQIALNYANYLNVIAKYDASTRMAFGKVKLNTEEKIPIEIKDNQEYSNTLALIVTNKNGQIVRREDNTTA